MFALLFGLLLEINTNNPNLCSVGVLRNNPEGYFWPLSYVQMFVDSADVIVRVEASRMGPLQRPDPLLGYFDTEIRFNVLEVLKGPSQTKEVVVAGEFVEKDDFNLLEVPYRMVRPLGQRGDCFATQYKRGAQYLLILRRHGEVLTPYWRSLAPLNEQVRGEDDKWVRWVRNEIKR